jgi:hypothetical protein
LILKTDDISPLPINQSAIFLPPKVSNLAEKPAQALTVQTNTATQKPNQISPTSVKATKVVPSNNNNAPVTVQKTEVKPERNNPGIFRLFSNNIGQEGVQYLTRNKPIRSRSNENKTVRFFWIFSNYRFASIVTTWIKDGLKFPKVTPLFKN